MPRTVLNREMVMASLKKFSPLPGFRLSLGYTLFYLTLIVLIPLSAVFLKTFEMDWARFVEVVTAPQVVATYKLAGIRRSKLEALFHRLFSPLPASALVVALWAFITRGFHLDGLADTFDGIGGGFDRESRLAVMKDSRLGTFGGTALAAVLLLKTVILAEFGGRLEVLVLAPVLGRWGILIAMHFFPSARPGGMGDSFRKHCGRPQLIRGSLAALWAALLTSGLHGLPLLAIVPALTVLFSLWIKRLIGGLTGDSYGAVCEIVELATLLFFAAL